MIESPQNFPTDDSIARVSKRRFIGQPLAYARGTVTVSYELSEALVAAAVFDIRQNV
jgi:hypothetical protein